LPPEYSGSSWLLKLEFLRVLSAKMALVATPKTPPPLGGENYVVVTIEEVELSLNAVVALPSDDEDDDAGAADAALEARVAATQQVADVQELWMLERSATARRDAASFGGSSEADVPEDDELRRNQLRASLITRQAPCPALHPPPAFATTAELVARGERGVSYTHAAEARATARDGGEAQSRRDVERDRLLLDGRGPALEGGRVGYDRVVAALVAAQRTLVRRADAAAWRGVVDDAALEAFAKAALVAVNRTESGGAALDAVVATVAGADGAKLLVPVPDSRRAEPLRVHLDLGPYASGRTWRWGLRARVEGTTFYRLFAPDDFDAERLQCAARYANALLLPLDGLGAEAVVRDASHANVVVALEPPDPKQA